MTKFEDFAKYYVENWGVNIVLMTPHGSPLYQWRQFESEKMQKEDVDRIWREHGDKIKAQPIILAMVTGSYQAKSSKPAIVVDIDSISKERKQSAIKELLKIGYTVVDSPRGLHIHAFINDSKENLPYLLALYEDKERKNKTGEGGLLGTHLWNMPPSTRALADKWFTYRFALKDGQYLSTFDKEKLDSIMPPTVSLKEFISDMETVLAYNVSTYVPIVAGSEGIKTEGELLTEGRHAIFTTTQEFLASAPSIPLPRCMAWVLYNYFNSISDIDSAEMILAQFLDSDELRTLVPHGKRKLVSNAFTLFMAHLIENVTYEDIVNILSRAIEDFPKDSGMALDKAIKYLLYADKEGYVYPRYGGLGAMNLKPVLGEIFCDSSHCPYYKTCNGANPWKTLRKLYKKIEVGRTLQ